MNKKVRYSINSSLSKGIVMGLFLTFNVQGQQNNGATETMNDEPIIESSALTSSAAITKPAKPTLKPILKKDTYIIGVEDVAYYPLFDFINSDDTFTTELFSKFSIEYGYNFKFYPMPVKRFGMWLFEQDIDLKFPDNVRWNESNEENVLSKQVKYSEPVLHLVAGTLTSDPNVQSKADVKVMGTLLGFYPTKWIDEINQGTVTLYESSSTLMLIQQLIKGQLDAINLEPSVVSHYISKLNKENKHTDNQLSVKVNTNFDYDVYSYHLSSLKHPYLIADFDKFLSENEALINALRRKYKIVDHTPYVAEINKKARVNGL